MTADMISMMSDHGIRVEIVPLQPTIKVSGLSEVLHVLFRILKNPLSSHLHWLNSATKLGNLFCMTSSTTGTNSMKPNSIFRMEHFSSAVVATNTFQELGYAMALRKYLLWGAVSVSEFKIWNNMCKRFAGWTSRPDPRAIGGAHRSTGDSMSPQSWGKTSLLQRDSTQSKLALRTKGALVGERNQLSDVGQTRNPIRDTSMESTSFQRIEKMEPRELRPGGNSIGIPFGTSGTLATSEARGARGPSKLTKAITRHWYRRFSTALALLSATQWTTGLSGSLDHLHQKQAEVPVIFTRENCGLKAKQMVNHDLDEPGTCRNLGELANVGHCCGRLNIGIGIRGNLELAECRQQKGSSSHFGVACHPQNCQSACPVTEWNEMQLPGVSWHQQNLQDPQATGSGLSAQWKLHVKSENEVCCHSFIAMFCKVPGVLAHYLEVQRDYVLKSLSVSEAGSRNNPQ
ncbi:hypothetical protein B0H14DRAFT_2655029 [Mycena olivaceomarginata]|nr:hypothetical protein B0H14DRAFT_2655029 [Mycena olivaceomarginata]